METNKGKARWHDRRFQKLGKRHDQIDSLENTLNSILLKLGPSGVERESFYGNVPVIRPVGPAEPPIGISGPDVPVVSDLAPDVAENSDQEMDVGINAKGHNVFTHFPFDKNCPVCQNCKMKKMQHRQSRNKSAEHDGTNFPRHSAVI